MIIYSNEDFPQMSGAWFDLKAGIPGGSVADKIITATGKPSTQGWGHINALIAETLGCNEEKREPTDWMLRGIEMEAEARKDFEFDQGVTVDQVGWITNDDGTAGCSPDGIIQYAGKKVGWEVKCPMGKTQCGYLRKAFDHHLGNNIYAVAALPTSYKPQVHWSMAVTGLQEWWFMSYHPMFKPVMIRVSADDYTVKMRAALNSFVADLAATKEKLGIA